MKKKKDFKQEVVGSSYPASQEFEETMLIFKEMRSVLQLEHDLKMKRLLAERENQKAFHDNALERRRIKTAEIRKHMVRKQDGEFANNYWKKDGQ